MSPDLSPSNSERSTNPYALERILDANLDRAREGLRVLEDWFRFGWEDGESANLCKDMRQRLAHWHRDIFRKARNVPADPGMPFTHTSEATRTDTRHVLQANCSRVQEALRVLEEYAKLLDRAMAADCKRMRYSAYELENALLSGELRHRLSRAQLYLVTSPVPNWLDAVEAALQGGARMVQYRHKTADYRTMRAEALALKALCDRYDAIALVNDRVDLALDIGAEGIHLGQTDMSPARARQLLGPHCLIGQSTTNEAELEAALASPIDYIGVGPVYATPTKPDKSPAGLDYVRLAARRATLPWYAIGGIAPETLLPVVAAGATRVAVVRSLMVASDPSTAARQILDRLGAPVAPSPCLVPPRPLTAPNP